MSLAADVTRGVGRAVDDNANDQKTQLAQGMRDAGVSDRERGSDSRGERRSERMSRRRELLSGATHSGREGINGRAALNNANSENGAACPGYERYGGSQARRGTKGK